MPPVITVENETALPVAGAPAEASGQPNADQLDQSTDSSTEGGEGQEAKEQPEKREKTPEEREIARLRRRVDNLTRQKYERDSMLQQLQQRLPEGRNEPPTDSQDDDGPVQLSKRELQALIDQKAKELAPTIKQQDAEIEHRKAVVQNLEKTWGKEKFDSLASDLDAAFEGITDRSGRPKPATEAIFLADDPASLIEYLADPDHADEADSIAHMDSIRAARAIAKLEVKLSASKADAKPQPSKAPQPLESARGKGTLNNAPDPSDTKAWMKWANEQERKQR